MSDILKAARRLANDGFSIIWLKERSKAPVGHNWTEQPTQSPDELEDGYRDRYNAGARLGKPSKVGDHYLCAVDIDIRDPAYEDEALAQAEKLLGTKLLRFPTVISGSGKGSRHLYALTETPYRSRKLWHSETKMIDDEGKKHWCAEIEFFGTGKQVVIPPSIHPDTGKAYRWKEPFDKDQLPTLDEDRLSALLDDDGDDNYSEEDAPPLGLTITEAREILETLKDWANDRGTWAQTGMALKHEFGDRAGWRLFDEWSKKGMGYDKTENLVQWRSFGRSHRGRPVTMRSLRKEANDRNIIEMLDEGTLLPDYAPAGITSKEAIEIFDEIDAEFSTDEDVRKHIIKKIPQHLLTIPGVLDKAVQHYNETCVQSQPQFAVQTALALGSVILGRRHKAKGIGVGNYTSLYLMIVGDTSSGKEFSRTFIRIVLGDAGMLRLMVTEGYASAPGLFSELFHRPRHIFIEDEIGMRRASNTKSPDPHAEAVGKKLTSIFGDLEGIVTPPTYSMRGKTKMVIEEERSLSVQRPAITTLAMTTPDVFYDNLSQAQIEDGFLNRILIVRSPLSKGLSLRQESKATPVELIEWMQDYGMTDDQWEAYDGEEDPLGLTLKESPTKVEPARVYDLTDEARAFERECEASFVKLFHQHKPLGLQNIFARSHEIMLRIALIVALSCRKKRIGREHVKWAYDYVHFYVLQMAEDAASRIGSSPLVRIAQEIFDLLSATGPKGLAQWEIAKKNHRFAKLSTREQEEVLARLTTNKNVREVHVKPAGRGRKPATRYIHPEYDRE
jgi:hypothetical protein